MAWPRIGTNRSSCPSIPPAPANTDLKKCPLSFQVRQKPPVFRGCLRCSEMETGLCLIKSEANSNYLSFVVLSWFRWGRLMLEFWIKLSWICSTQVRVENPSGEIRWMHPNASLVVRQKRVCLRCSETKPPDASGVVRLPHL